MIQVPNSNGDFSGEKDPDFKSLKATLLSPSTERKMLSKIICSLLDIRDGFLDELESSPENIRDHEPLNDWLLNFLESNYEEIEDTSMKRNLNEELLVEIGFKEGSDAVKTILKRSKLVPDHIDPIDAVTRFVRDKFKYHPVLSTMYYGLSEVALDSKDLNVPGVNVSDDGGTIIEDDSSRLLFSEHLSMLCTDELHTVLYHGTDSQSAHSIRSGGIYIKCGFRRRDFSDGTGFYLTKSYVHARDWAFSQTQKNKPVVLGFKVPTKFLKQATSLDLTDKSKQSQWRKIITQNRAGKLTKSMRTFLKKYHFIEGPISVLSKPESNKDDCEQQQHREAKFESHQLCIISHDFAKNISRYLTTVITYRDEL